LIWYGKRLYRIRNSAQHSPRIGSGYSNLSHVLQLEVDNLKIDGSLIRRLDEDGEACELVETIVDMAAAVHIPHVTAEFVHSPTVLAQVRRLGVDYAQGYAIGKPMASLLESDQLLHLVVDESTTA
jgi:EAL domain-containing protein (putative c-di-GMP-specific phosphodiesterase class I)